MTDTHSKIVGMVGLGEMGRPIAENIARAGFTVLGYDRSPQAQADGVIRVDSLAGLAPAEVVIVIVPTDADVTEVVAGPGGLFDHG
jgi:3-hydroxyisobutyrate dehydrogenase-like beta-hydroxyacid dehydrogenase